MGLWLAADYDDRRYDYAEQYIRILRDLWRHGKSTLESVFFTLDDCVCELRPQREIPVVCAGPPSGAR